MNLDGFLKPEGVDAYLIHTDSHRSADMFYATGFSAGDAFTYLNLAGGREVLLVSSMEKGRAVRESRIADVRSTSDYGIKEKLKEYRDAGLAYCQVIVQLLKKEGCGRIAVPRDFPLFFAEVLRGAGISLIPVESPFLAMREKKTENEIKAISNTQRACERAVAKALDVIAGSGVKDDVLVAGDELLTAEAIRAVIHHSLLDSGCEARDTIVACGTGSADPHWKGEGVLKARQPIVLDVFPSHSASRYYCDMSRTIVRGEPDPKIREMHLAVLAAQEVAFGLLAPGVKSSDVHQAVCDSFIDAGFHVGDEEGFIHSTGHSLGLDVHEKPGLGWLEDTLEKGNVVTVEPGLYYRDVGGVRVEDMVVITGSGYENLTKFHKNLRI